MILGEILLIICILRASDEFFLANNVEIWYNMRNEFEYDSYGKLINRTGEHFVIFGYNGRDGNTMVNSIVNKLLFDENEKNYSRK